MVSLALKVWASTDSVWTMITAEKEWAAWNNVSVSFSSEEEQGNQIIGVFESLTSDLCIYTGINIDHDGHLSSDKYIKYHTAVFQASCFPILPDFMLS